MAVISGKGLAFAGLLGLVWLTGLPAAAQMTAAQAQQAEAAAQAQQQQLQQQQQQLIGQQNSPAYQAAMSECVGKVFPVPDPSGGQIPDPRTYQMTADKMQLVKRCMNEKSLPVWPAPETPGAAAPDTRQAASKKPPEAADNSQSGQPGPDGNGPGAGEPANAGQPPPPEAEEPALFNAPSAGGGDNDATKPVWIPQSQ